MLKKNILIADRETRELLLLIKNNYVSNNKNTIQEVNLNHVANRISNEMIKNYIVSCWYKLEQKVGYQLTLLENHYKAGIFNKLYKKSSKLSFVAPMKVSNNFYESNKFMKQDSKIDIFIQEFIF